MYLFMAGISSDFVGFCWLGSGLDPGASGGRFCRLLGYDCLQNQETNIITGRLHEHCKLTSSLHFDPCWPSQLTDLVLGLALSVL